MLKKEELVKLDLLAEGMKVSDKARIELTCGGTVPLSLFEYATTSGIPLKIKGSDVYINSPFAEQFCQSARWELDFSGKKFFIFKEGEEVEVEPLPLPRYFDNLNAEGAKYGEFVMTHTDRARLSPIAGCSNACDFCDLPRSFQYQKKSLTNMLDALQVALDDPHLPAKHILISGGNPRPEDEHYLDEVYEMVAHSFAIPVDIMMIPRKDVTYVDRLKSWGINELSINLEVFNEDLAAKLMRSKYIVGREAYQAFLERAVEEFGNGCVRSMLLVGLEPQEDTLKGVELLAKMGVSPVLSPFRPSPKTPLAHLPPPTASQMAGVYERSREIAERYGVKMGPRCIPCHHNTLSFPDGSDYYYYSGMENHAST